MAGTPDRVGGLLRRGWSSPRSAPKQPARRRPATPRTGPGRPAGPRASARAAGRRPRGPPSRGGEPARRAAPWPGPARPWCRRAAGWARTIRSIARQVALGSVHSPAIDLVAPRSARRRSSEDDGAAGEVGGQQVEHPPVDAVGVGVDQPEQLAVAAPGRATGWPARPAPSAVAVTDDNAIGTMLSRVDLVGSSSWAGSLGGRAGETSTSADTRSGCRAARCVAIRPPIELPCRVNRSQPSASAVRRTKSTVATDGQLVAVERRGPAEAGQVDRDHRTSLGQRSRMTSIHVGGRAAQPVHEELRVGLGDAPAPRRAGPVPISRPPSQSREFLNPQPRRGAAHPGRSWSRRAADSRFLTQASPARARHQIHHPVADAVPSAVVRPDAAVVHVLWRKVHVTPSPPCHIQLNTVHAVSRPAVP